MKHLTALLSATALAGLATAATAETWDMPLAYPATNFHSETAAGFADCVREATGGDIRGDFFPPQGVVRMEIDPDSGARALRRCPRRRTEYFLEGTEPEATCPGKDGFASRFGEGRGA